MRPDARSALIFDGGHMKEFKRPIACVALLLGSTSSIAYAQSDTIPEPPVRSPTDEQDVHLSTGGVQVTDPGITIGPAGSGLTHVRHWMNNGWRHGFFLTVTTSSTIARVSVGGRSTTFTHNGSNYVSDLADGSTLTLASSVFIYTMADGTVITFDPALVVNDERYYGTVEAVGTLIEAPDGERVSLTYKTDSYSRSGGSRIYVLRLQSVTSNAGYQLKYEYATNTPSQAAVNDWYRITKVTGINNAVDYCDPAADACANLTQSWPSTTYAETAFGTDKLETVTDTLSRQRRYRTDSAGRLTAIKRAGANADTSAFVYGGDGRVSSATREGHTRTYGWSLSGNELTSASNDSLGRQRTVKSDIVKQAITYDARGAMATTYTIDGNGRTTEVIAPEGNKVQVTYDSRGNVTQRRAIAKNGSGLPDVVVSWGFPSNCVDPKTCNKPSSFTDARGQVTNYTYDATHGGVSSVLFPAPAGSGPRPETRYTYLPQYAYYKDGSGNIVPAASPIYKQVQQKTCDNADLSTCEGTLHETRLVTQYGTPGVANNLLPTSVTVSAGGSAPTSSTTMAYDPVGNLLTIDGPLPGAADTTRYRHDAMRQQVGVVGPDPDGVGPLKHRATRTSYSLDGQVTLTERGTVDSQSDAHWMAFSPLQKTLLNYDINGRLETEAHVAVSGPDMYQARQFSYDAAGRLTCTALRMNAPYAWTTLPTSACEAMTPGTHGPDRIVSNTYNSLDQITTVTSAVGTALQQDTVRTSYTANGRIFALRDARGGQTIYEYDGFDRLGKIRYPEPASSDSSSTTDYEQFGYDVASNVASVRLRDGNSIYLTYDYLNRMTFKDLPGGEPDIAYGYDLMGRLISASSSSGTYGFTYDAIGRNLTAVSPQGTISFQYDEAGRRTRMIWPDAFYVDYDYLVTGEVHKIRENGVSSGLGVLATYSHDDLGRLTSLVRGNGASTSYGYDAASRLSSLADDLSGTSADQTSSFSYNSAFDIVSRTRSNNSYAWNAPETVRRSYVANRLNQYTASGSVTPAYDAKGNLTSAGGSTFGYSSENLLISSSSPAATLSYDPLGRLYRTTGSATLRLGYDGNRLVAEYDDANTLLRRYVHGPGADAPLVWYEGSGTSDRRWLHADERGSVTAVGNSSGAPAAINTYDEYGIPGIGNLGRFQYTGQTWLSDLGFYYYKARMYSPTLGRFLQPDPIGYGDGMNRYAYVGNNPVNFTDPTGLFCSKMRGGRYDGDKDRDECNRNDEDDEGEVVVTGWRSSLGRAAAEPSGYSAGSDGSSGGSSIGTVAQLNKQCYGPPAAPGTGLSKAKLKEWAQANGAEAAKHYSNAVSALWFRSQVRNKGPWDYKQYHRGLQDFGNYNYGYTGKAAGIAPNILLQQAGRAQIAAGTSKPGWGKPGPLGGLLGGGTPPYGDDPHDQEMIRRGIADRTNGC